MKYPLSLVALVFLFVAGTAVEPAAATEPNQHASIGPGVGRVAQVFGQSPRDGESYAEHCDGTFENAYNWRDTAVGDPCYGSFAERFDLGSAVEVTGIRLYLTQTGYYHGGLTEDLFVWGRGIGVPGGVLAVVPDVPMDPPSLWPQVSAHEFAIYAMVGSTFYLGGKSNYPEGCNPVFWHHAVDADGPTIGEPWTCILPAIPDYPDGWQDVDTVWEDNARSMGIGVYYITGVSSVPADGPQYTRTSWGRVKSLYDR